MSDDDLHLSPEGRAFVHEMKRRIEAGEVRHHDLTNMTAEERAASIAEGLVGAMTVHPMMTTTPMHSRVRFLRDIGEGRDPCDWAKAGEEGTIVDIIPSPDPNAPARCYMIEIVTQIDGVEFTPCRLVSCSPRDVEVIWSPDDPT